MSSPAWEYRRDRQRLLASMRRKGRINDVLGREPVAQLPGTWGKKDILRWAKESTKA